MPYIKEKDREAALDMFEDAGDFAYKLTDVILDYLFQKTVKRAITNEDIKGWKDKIKFSTYSHAIGVLECVKLELYRRMIAPYEDRKCEENGDVY